MLKRANMVESTSGTNALTLEAKAGESILIKSIHNWVAAAGAEDISVAIDRKKIMQFKAPSGWYLLANKRETGYEAIVDELAALGLLSPIPVAEGETITITAPGASDYLDVVYDLYDAADIRNNAKNGSKGSNYDLIQVVSNAGTRASAGDLALDQSDLDSLFPAFPGGDVVPAKHTMILKALFGAAATKGTGAANGEYTTKIKMLADREDILDADLTGIDFLGDASYTTAAVKYQSLASRIRCGGQYILPRVFVFDEPIVFESGSELNVFATIGRTGAGADFAAADVKLGMLFEVQVA